MLSNFWDLGLCVFACLRRIKKTCLILYIDEKNHLINAEETFWKANLIALPSVGHLLCHHCCDKCVIIGCE